jgi:membrane fusion protein (multidrug efflux system)
MRRRLWWLSLVLTMGVLGAGLYLHLTTVAMSTHIPHSPEKAVAAPPVVAIERLPVKTVQAQIRDLAVTLPVFGAITPLNKVEVASEINGILKKVPVEPGDLVRKGQVVAVIDTDVLRAELKAKAALKAQAEAQLQLAAWQYQAQQKVHKVGGISLNDLEEAQAKYREKKAEVARYSAEMAQIQTQIQKATITSPIDAIVGLKNYHAGERIPSQSEKGVVTLMEIDEVYAEAEVNERDMARLRPGLAAIAYPDAYAKKEWRGKIERLEPVLKEESRSLIAKVRLPNPKLLLKPGMFSRIDIILDEIPQVTAIPTAALRQAPDKSWQVFVVNDEVAFLRKISIGLSTPNWTEVTAGLKPGDVVVIEGGERLRDLSRVISTPASQPGP